MGRLETRSRVDRVLKGRGLSHVFQPVFDITTVGVLRSRSACSVLGRPTKRAPDAWFAEAHVMGIGVELEVVSRRSF